MHSICRDRNSDTQIGPEHGEYKVVQVGTIADEEAPCPLRDLLLQGAQGWWG